MYVRATCAEAFGVIMGELVEIRLVLPWQAEGLLCHKILLFLPCQEPRGITEASSLRHSTAGWGVPVAAHRSRTFSPSWTTIGLEGCCPPGTASNNVNSHVENANELVQMLVVQQVKKTAASTWPVVHYGVHKIAPFFAVVNLLNPVFTFAPCIFKTEVHKFSKNLWATLQLWATEGWYEPRNQQMLDATVHNLVACVTCRPRFLHSRSKASFHLALPYRLCLEFSRLSDSHTVCIFYFSHIGYMLYLCTKDTRWKVQIKKFQLM